MTEKEAMRHVEEAGAFYIYDVVNTYRKALATKQDIHVLCPISEEWNYEIISRDIVEVLSSDGALRITDDYVMSLIAKATIKTVIHCQN